MNYSEEDRREIAIHAAEIGADKAARLYGVTGQAVRNWQKKYIPKVPQKEVYGGYMDRRFCRSCTHGCGATATFTGCTYLLDTNELRPHTEDGWCKGFAPRKGTSKLLIAAYRREGSKHTDGADEEDEDHMAEVNALDEQIILKSRCGNKFVKEYSAEEKARVMEHAREHGVKDAAAYFAISGTSIRKWMKDEKNARKKGGDDVKNDANAEENAVITEENAVNAVENAVITEENAVNAVENAHKTKAELFNEAVDPIIEEFRRRTEEKAVKEADDKPRDGLDRLAIYYDKLIARRAELLREADEITDRIENVELFMELGVV